MMEVTLEDVKLAYFKLKHYLYHDKAHLNVRAKIAKFENTRNFSKRLEKLVNIFNNKNEDIWDQLLEQIDVNFIPKSVESKISKLSTSPVISNYIDSKDVYVKRWSYFIEAPIQIHIMATLWSIKVGYNLQNEMSVIPFGNKLNLNNGGTPCKSKILFEPYFKLYSKWRDNAITTAKNVVESNKDAIIFCLDIKSCYDTIKIDNNSFKKTLKKYDKYDNYNYLTDKLLEIHEKYLLVHPNIDKGLPIGLVSSGVICNWFLKDFDERVFENLSPEYYGRYVDDIFIVISTAKNKSFFKKNKSEKEIQKYLIETYLVNNFIVEKDEYIELEDNETKKKIQYFLEPSEFYKKRLSIQEEKLLIYYFDKNQPTNLLDQFVSEVRKNSSEFRFLPTSEELEDNFDEISHTINFDESPNKLRSIIEFKEDSYSIAKFLGKKIIASTQTKGKIDKKSTKQIVKFFKGWRAITYKNLWERTFTLLLISNQSSSARNLFNQISDAINNLKSDQGHCFAGQTFLHDYLIHSISLAFSLNPKFSEEVFESKSLIANIFKNTRALRRTAMIRHRVVPCSLLSLTKVVFNDDMFDLTNHANLDESQIKDFDLSIRLTSFCPKYVHLHECCLFFFHQQVVLFESMDDSDFELYVQDLIEKSYEMFHKINNPFRIQNEVNSIITEDEHPFNPIKSRILKINLQDDLRMDKLKVALANLKVNEKSFSNKYIKYPRPNISKREDLLKIFAESGRSETDLLVLPEISIPRHWLPWICEYHSRRHQVAMVFGLEHWKIGNKVYNFIITLLPVKINGYEHLIVVPRLKNYYAPGEKSLLEGYRYKIPSISPSIYNLFIWRNLHFTVFNCYELTNIEDRSYFKSKVDFIITCEWNKDIPLFSSIVESSSRDLHCYIIQSNTSQYGDSRITQPTKSELKDIVKFKGGENPTALVTTINIDLLRQFQILSHKAQEKGYFKLTPPDFDREAVGQRIDDSEAAKPFKKKHK